MHNIHISLINKSLLPESLLASLLSMSTETTFNVLEHTAFLDVPEALLKTASQFAPVYILFTDYFGGGGTQGATRYYIDSQVTYTSINHALQDMGVVISEDNQDEFETIGLGNFRSNDKFTPVNPSQDSATDSVDADLSSLELSDESDTPIQTIQDLKNALNDLDPEMAIQGPISFMTASGFTYTLK